MFLRILIFLLLWVQNLIFSEEEFHISASDKEWQVRGDDEIDSYSEYELDGYVIEEIS